MLIILHIKQDSRNFLLLYFNIKFCTILRLKLGTLLVTIISFENGIEDANT